MIQTIGRAIQLFTNNFVLFSSIVLTIWLPGAILLTFLRLYIFPGTTGGDEAQMFMQEIRVSNLIELAFGPIYTGAMLYAAAQLQQGLQPTYSESMRHGAKRSFDLLLTRIVVGFFVVLGLLAFIIPGVILSLRFALVDAVVVLENLSAQSARKRSTQLTQGKRWSILGALLLTGIVLMAALLLISFVLYIPVGLAGQTDNFVVSVIVECIGSVLVSFTAIVLFIFYWDAKSQTDRN